MADSVAERLPNRWIRDYYDIIIAGVIVGVVIMMIVPVPVFLLDILLTASITLGLVIILTVMYMRKAIEFSAFPTVLLLATLFRLALNISSTRLILLQGPQFASKVIRAFGQFVVGGQIVIGIVIFVVITVVQLIVITRGAARISEVAARFTLDAMPGKQMAIDADLNAGIITEEEANERRLEIRREADFYGAMDGAAKFVQGDVIAGIIITFIDIIGGLAMGVIVRREPFREAVDTYTLLTVGDGLVAIIPSLLISTATGIIVSRAASEGSLGQDLTSQVMSQPRALGIASGVLFLLGIVPGLPTIPFFILAASLGAAAYLKLKGIRQAEAERLRMEKAAEEEVIKKPESVVSLIHVDPMELEIGYSLIPLADPNQGGDLLDRVLMIRRQTALDLGLVVPPIRIRDNMRLKPNAYVIKIKNVEVAGGELMVDRYLAMNPGTVTEEIEGEQTVEPTFGLPAVWITESQRARAERAGYTVVDPPSIIATHLTEIIKRHAHEILGRQELQSVLDRIKENYPAVVDEVVPNLLSLGEIHAVCCNLLREGVSIRDMVTILESLADNARVTKDTGVLTEYVREALARQISKQYQNARGVIPVITLDPALEETISGSIQETAREAYIALAPEVAQKILDSLSKQVERAVSMGNQAIVLCSSAIRRHFKRLTERVAPDLVVLSYNEIVPTVRVESVGMVTI
ncbi:MAG: flagellar biosynthesis protein FlhA [bacterium]